MGYCFPQKCLKTNSSIFHSKQYTEFCYLLALKNFDVLHVLKRVFNAVDDNECDTNILGTSIIG